MRPSARDLGRKLKLLRYGVRPTRLKPLDGGGREGTGSGAQHSLVLVRWFAGGEVCRARYCNCSSRRGRGERDEPGRKALCYCSARCGGRLWMTALDARLNLNLNLNSNKSAMRKGQVEPASCFLLPASCSCSCFHASPLAACLTLHFT